MIPLLYLGCVTGLSVGVGYMRTDMPESLQFLISGLRALVSSLLLEQHRDPSPLHGKE